MKSANVEREPSINSSVGRRARAITAEHAQANSTTQHSNQQQQKQQEQHSTQQTQQQHQQQNNSQSVDET